MPSPSPGSMVTEIAVWATPAVATGDPTTGPHLGAACDHRLGARDLAGTVGCGHLTGLHATPVRRWRRHGPMTVQQAPARPIHTGTADVQAARTVVALFGAGSVFVALWPLLLMLMGPAPLSVMALLAHSSGMLAGYAVLVMLVVMSRWPLLERGIGADVLARWHAAGGPTILTLVLVHASFAVLAWSGLTGQDPVSAARQVLTWPGLPTATVATALMVAVAVASARSARQRLRWETWHLLHLSMYIAVALGFSHQLAGPDIAGRPWLQATWGVLYALTFALVVRYRLLAPLQAAMRHRLRVVAVLPEAPGVVSIVLQGRHVAALQAEPGQFFRWRFLTRDSWGTAHPFSLSAPPVENRLRLTVKALGDGSQRLQRVP